MLFYQIIYFIYLSNFYKFERDFFSQSVNSLLLIQESKITKTRNRSQDAKNINKQEQVFEVFTSRISSQFERIEMKTAIINNEEISTKIERIIQQTNSVSKCERERERERSREREQEQEQERKRKRERERNRARDTRDRDRERDEAIETMRNNNDDEIKDVFAAK